MHFIKKKTVRLTNLDNARKKQNGEKRINNRPLPQYPIQKVKNCPQKNLYFIMPLLLLKKFHDEKIYSFELAIVIACTHSQFHTHLNSQ